MTPNEIAKRDAEYLHALPATVTVEGAIIRLTNDRGTFEIECLGEDWFLIGPSPMNGGFQVQVREPRAQVNRKQLFERARAWAQPNRMAS